MNIKISTSLLRFQMDVLTTNALYINYFAELKERAELEALSFAISGLK